MNDLNSLRFAASDISKKQSTTFVRLMTESGDELSEQNGTVVGTIAMSSLTQRRGRSFSSFKKDANVSFRLERLVEMFIVWSECFLLISY